MDTARIAEIEAQICALKESRKPFYEARNEQDKQIGAIDKEIKQLLLERNRAYAGMCFAWGSAVYLVLDGDMHRCDPFFHPYFDEHHLPVLKIYIGAFREEKKWRVEEEVAMGIELGDFFIGNIEQVEVIGRQQFDAVLEQWFKNLKARLVGKE